MTSIRSTANSIATSPPHQKRGKRDDFWRSTRILLHYKRQLALAAVGVLISTACFGAGLGMLLPILSVLVDKKQDVHYLIETHLLHHRLEVVRHLGQMLTNIIPADPFLALVTVLVSIGVLAVIGSIGRYIHEWVTITISARAAMAWRTRLFNRLIHLPMVGPLQRATGDHISRLVGDTRVLSQGYLAIMDDAVADILKGAGALVVAFFINWRLTTVALIAAPLIALLLRKFGKRIRRASRAALEQYGAVIGSLKESLGGAGTVKVHTAEGYERRRFGRINRRVFSQEMRMRQVKAISSPLIETIVIWVMIGVSLVAGYLILRSGNTIANFLALMAALGAAGVSLRPLTGLNNTLNEAASAATRVFEVMEFPVEPTGAHTPANAKPLPRHERSIEFERVSYTYPGGERPAVDGLTLSAAHGQTIAIVGGNGSGKTTLLSMLPRLLDPEAGRVLIDGTDIAGVTLRSLRRQIAVVTQQTILFRGTIAENIAYGRRHESMANIIAASKAAYADEFIAATPNGYETILGEDGAGLSGGQRQRLAIARAILRNPAILILDEATSQIDADSEAKITESLKNFRHGRTTFVIAHRLSTVVDADLIVVMDAGQIVDVGTHTALLSRCRVYQTLTQNQLLPPAA